MKEAESTQQVEITSYSHFLHSIIPIDIHVNCLQQGHATDSITQSSSTKEWNKDLAQSSILHQNSSVLQATQGIACNKNTGTYRRSAEAQGNYMQKGKHVKNKLGNWKSKVFLCWTY